MKIVLHWLILTLAIFAVPYVVNGIGVDSIIVAIIVAAVLGFINTVIRPVIGLLTLPLNIITFGLFSLVLNGLFFWFTAKIIDGFDVASFSAAFWGALIVSVLNWIGSKLIPSND